MSPKNCSGAASVCSSRLMRSSSTSAARRRGACVEHGVKRFAGASGERGRQDTKLNKHWRLQAEGQPGEHGTASLAAGGGGGARVMGPLWVAITQPPTRTPLPPSSTWPLACLTAAEREGEVKAAGLHTARSGCCRIDGNRAHRCHPRCPLCTTWLAVRDRRHTAEVLTLGALPGHGRARWILWMPDASNSH